MTSLQSTTALPSTSNTSNTIVSQKKSSSLLWWIIGGLVIAFILGLIIWAILHIHNKNACPKLDCGSNGTLKTLQSGTCSSCVCSNGYSGTTCQTPPTNANVFIPYHYQWTFDNPTGNIGNFHTGNSPIGGNCLYIDGFPSGSGSSAAYAQSCDIVTNNSFSWTMAPPSKNNPNVPPIANNVIFLQASHNNAPTNYCLQSYQCTGNPHTCANTPYWCSNNTNDNICNCNLQVTSCTTADNPSWIYYSDLGVLQHVGTGECLTWGNGGMEGNATGTQVNLQACPPGVPPAPAFSNSTCNNS